MLGVRSNETIYSAGSLQLKVFSNLCVRPVRPSCASILCVRPVRKNLGATFFPSPIDASRRGLFENDVLRCGVVVFSVEKLSAKNGRKRATFGAKRGLNVV